MTESKTDHIGFSDEDVDRERRAMKLDRDAYLHLEQAINLLREASTLSDLRHQELLMFADNLKDCCADYGINTQDWRAALSRARDGW